MASCSSQPKRTGDVYELRRQAEQDLELGNRQAGRGDYEAALLQLNECKRRATLADDPSLIIRSGLSRGNVLFALDRKEEAFAEWERSIAEAKKYEFGELLSVSKIYHARGRLLSAKDTARAVLDEVNREAPNIKSSRLYIAFSWNVKGLALHQTASYKEAEDAFKQSLAIHEKDLYLENAAYDWYMIASVRSLSGNVPGALEALEAAIALDRRIENAWGLASDWRAMGDVFRKSGKPVEAEEAYLRARDIYAALGNKHEIAETEKRMEN
jgi:tetratricopeptide (TPR) repeat protein